MGRQVSGREPRICPWHANIEPGKQGVRLRSVGRTRGKQEVALRSIGRPRRYVAKHWLAILGPAFRYSVTRDAFILRVVGQSVGPVLREDRRERRSQQFDGVERRRAHAA